MSDTQLYFSDSIAARSSHGPKYYIINYMHVGLLCGSFKKVILKGIIQTNMLALASPPSDCLEHGSEVCTSKNNAN